MGKKLIISAAPHIRSPESVRRIMWTVTLALLPSGLVGLFVFGISVLFITSTCIIAAVLTEAVILKLRKKPVTILDGSAVLTGLLLAYNLPSNIPLWLCVLGAIFAIGVAKQAFGGLGHNIFNPALAGRAFLHIAYPAHMVRWPKPWSVDAVTGATALEIKKRALEEILPSYLDLLLGNRGGSIGEVCVLALLAGAIFLLYKKYIFWQIPVAFVGTVGVFTWIFGGSELFTGDWLFHILAGGLILGAFYMATDPVTSPITKKGKLIFGFGCGLLTSVIRLWGGYPEGVSYSILLMNCAVPLIDRYMRPRVLGH